MNNYFTKVLGLVKENNTAVNPTVSSVGDFTPFYIAIAISCVILGSIVILNLVFCCSRYSDYWLDRHTGNRWIVSIWSATPHKQPPLDFTELKTQDQLIGYIYRDPKEYQREPVSASLSQQPLTSQAYETQHIRESDI